MQVLDKHLDKETFLVACFILYAWLPCSLFVAPVVVTIVIVVAFSQFFRLEIFQHTRHRAMLLLCQTFVS